MLEGIKKRFNMFYVHDAYFEDKQAVEDFRWLIQQVEDARVVNKVETVTGLALETQITDLESQNAKMREALEPWAKLSNAIKQVTRDSTGVVSVNIKITDIDRAKEAYDG